MEKMCVDYIGGYKFKANVRGHEIASDQPQSQRGEDTGPTPPEFFIFGLGACIAIYAQFFAERHDISLEGMKVEVEWEKAAKANQIDKIRAKVIVPGKVPERFRDALLRSATSCLLHNTIKAEPQIEVSLEN